MMTFLDDIPHEIQLVLEPHSSIFQPYHYPQFQKNEIEKLVEETLAAGIIQPSSNA